MIQDATLSEEQPARHRVVESTVLPQGSTANLYIRSQLNSLLDEVLRKRLTIVHAPAGYGKSTLIRTWCQLLEEGQITVFHLDLDEHDTDPTQFLEHFITHCVPNAVKDHTENGQNVVFSMESMVAAIRTSLCQSKIETLVMLDGLHRVASNEIFSCLDLLLDELPAHVHFLVSGRAYPRLRDLAQRKVAGEVFEVTQTDLCFSEEEVRLFLEPYLTQTADIFVKELREKTAGWPLALRVVRRWLEEGISTLQVLQMLSGRTAELSDYFSEQVFDILSKDEQSFLLRVSILDQIHGDLADSVCDRTDSWQTLETLERNGIFVTTYNSERIWYQLQRLFLEFLKERQKRLMRASMTQTLHKRASAWLKDAGYVHEGLQHAIDSADEQTIAQCAEDLGGWRYALTGHMSLLEAALSVLSFETIQSYPRLLFGQMLVVARYGNIEQTETLFSTYCSLYEAGEADDALLYPERLIIRNVLNRYGDREVTEDEITTLESLGSVLPNDDYIAHAARCNLLCIMYRCRGRFEASISVGDQAIQYFRMAGSPWGEVFLYFHEGIACTLQARMRDAMAFYRTGIELATEHFGSENDLIAIGKALLSEVCYEIGHIVEADQLIEDSLVHIEQSDAWLEVYVSSYLTALKLARLRNDSQAVLSLAQRACSTATFRGLPRLRTIISCTVERRFPEDTLEPLEPSDLSSDIVLRFAQISRLARDAITEKRFGDALLILSPELDTTRYLRIHRVSISYLCLTAIAQWNIDKHDDAVNALEEALALAIFEDIRRPFVDEGVALLEVMRSLQNTPYKKASNRMRDRFVARLAAEIETAGSYPIKDAEVLSKREREVMLFAVRGHSNREIADLLGITVNTIKFHMKNVFEKLSVSNRKDAIAACFRLSIF